jgi:DUF1680 family protein
MTETKMQRTLLIPVLMAATSLLLPNCRRASQDAKDYPAHAVSLAQVDIKDEFWAPWIERNRKVSIPYVFKKSRESGNPVSSVTYKTIEGSAYALAKTPDPELEATVDGWIDELISELIPNDPSEQWKGSYWDGKLYSAGHFIEAAIAYFHATKKRKMLDAAVQMADSIVSIYGPDKRRHVPGHAEIELALVELFRETGDPKYWHLAKFFLDERGRSSQGSRATTLPHEAEGHCVQATYGYIGMTDIAALTGDTDYLGAIGDIWKDANRKTYVTGGIGSIRFHEQYGAPYELPNLSAWGETCAAFGNFVWNHRLFLLHRHARYVDMMERTLYNGFLVGVSLTGDRFFYQNPLKSFGHYQRFAWINVPCCPPNVVRLIASLGSYIYAKDRKDLYINLFIASRATVSLGGNVVAIDQKTRYPWEGGVTIEVNPEHTGRFAVYLRIPGWTRNQPMPGDLYACMDESQEKVSLEVNGEPIEAEMERGFVRIDREWSQGDVIEMRLPMPVRRVLAHENVIDDRGRIALERGPLVYCAEWPDNDASVLNLWIPDDAALTSMLRKDLLDGIVTLEGDVMGAYRGDDGVSIETQPHRLVAIPYYAWANRGRGEMAVWMARGEDKVRLAPVLPKPIKTARSFGELEKIETGYNDQNDDISAVYDGIDPISSADESHLYYRLRPPPGQPAWLEYELEEMTEVSSAEVYWVDDRRFCRLPKAWCILYKDGGEWKPVRNPSSYGVEKDQFNEVVFDPIRTRAIRLEVEPQSILYRKGEIGPPAALFIEADIEWRECGVIEWRIH